jgi:hypothetical protein
MPRLVVIFSQEAVLLSASEIRHLVAGPQKRRELPIPQTMDEVLDDVVKSHVGRPLRAERGLCEAVLLLGVRCQRHPVTGPVRDPEEAVLAAGQLGEEVGRRPVHELHEEAVRQRARHL